MSNNIFSPGADKEFELGYWYLTHKVLIRQVLIMILAAISGSLFLFGVVGLVKYYIVDAGKNAALEKSLAQTQLNFAKITELGAPTALDTADTVVFAGRDSDYDFVGVVNNDNETWYAESFDYYFQYGDGEKTPVKTDFALPFQQKYLLNLGISVDKRIADAQLVIENVKWKKVPEYKSLQEKIVKFEFPTKSLAPVISGNAKSSSVTGLTFDVANLSAYSFWEPKFVILFYRSDTLVGVNQTILPEISTSEKKTQTINIFQPLPSGVRIEILPDINILDPNVFKGFANGSGEEK